MIGTRQTLSLTLDLLAHADDGEVPLTNSALSQITPPNIRFNHDDITVLGMSSVFLMGLCLRSCLGVIRVIICHKFHESRSRPNF